MVVIFCGRTSCYYQICSLVFSHTLLLAARFLKMRQGKEEAICSIEQVGVLNLNWNLDSHIISLSPSCLENRTKKKTFFPGCPLSFLSRLFSSVL